MRNWSIMFLGQGLSYALISLGFIAISEREPLPAFVIDVATYIVGFVVLKRLLEAKSWSLVWAAALGGGAGTVLAIEASRFFI